MVPNAVRIMILESIVKQYLTYADECGQAFDELSDVVDRLGEELMGMTWAREIKECLKSAKRYLKSDYKVILTNVTNICNWFTFAAYSKT